jgi:GxxExxY protein
MLYADLTEQILAVCFEVSNELGAGFLESVYQNALIIALQARGLSLKQECPLTVFFRKQIVGQFYADVLVENKIIVELKAVTELSDIHKAQVINYLKATDIEVGLLVNFGSPKLEYRRYENRFLQKEKTKSSI